MNGSAFEGLVHSIAKELWEEHGGVVNIDGREVDGVYETEDSIHIVEATIQRSKSKAFHDINKLAKIVQKYRKQLDGEKLVKGWFVAKNPLTPEQREIAAKKEYKTKVTAVSFADFQQKLVDVRSYLLSRDNYSFGSVRDPGSGKYNVDIEYIPIYPVFKKTRDRQAVDIKEMSRILKEGHLITLTGDYGVGKSMTLREVYKCLKNEYYNGKSQKFPVYMNMRDHYGQTNPSEAFFRHASNIGFEAHSHLIRAWRAGYVILLLDGFDEIATSGFSGFKTKLVEARFKAMELIRRLISESHSDAGIIVSGRVHFFNTHEELEKALGISGSACYELSLNDFDDDQLKLFMESLEQDVEIPNWLPRRPLLLGYLAAKGFIRSIASESLQSLDDAAGGWNYLLDKISEREAEQEPGLDGGAIRAIMERIATLARKRSSGLGPISLKDLCDVYEDVCGIEPDEKGLNVLQKLPGLGVDNEDEKTRAFIDEDLADACRSGDIIRFIENYTEFESVERKIDITSGFEVPTGNICTSLIKKRATERNFRVSGSVYIAAQKGFGQFALDLFKVCLLLSERLEKDVYINSAFGGDLAFLNDGRVNFSGVNFYSCYFNMVDAGKVDSANLPSFKECYLLTLAGLETGKNIPDNFDDDCVIEAIEGSPSVTTNSSALESDLPLAERVMLSMLRKIYQQAGSGRLENALYAGLDHASKQIVPDLLKELEGNGLVKPLRRRGKPVIWQPVPEKKSKVFEALENPGKIDFNKNS